MTSQMQCSDMHKQSKAKGRWTWPCALIFCAALETCPASYKTCFSILRLAGLLVLYNLQRFKRCENLAIWAVSGQNPRVGSAREARWQLRARRATMCQTGTRLAILGLLAHCPLSALNLAARGGGGADLAEGIQCTQAEKLKCIVISRHYSQAEYILATWWTTEVGYWMCHTHPVFRSPEVWSSCNSSNFHTHSGILSAVPFTEAWHKTHKGCWIGDVRSFLQVYADS